MKNNWKSFLSLCLKTNHSEELSKLLDCFLTIKEKEAIADRYSIIEALLAEKMTQRDIALKLNVSIAKITRGSNALKLINPKLKAFIQKSV